MSKPKSKLVANQQNPMDKILSPNLTATEQETKSILKEIEVERKWYQRTPRFKTYQEIEDQYRQGKLTKITGNKNYLLILRFRNPELNSLYPPFLTVRAKNLLDKIGENWRVEMNTLKLDPQIKLSITSLTRTIAYQKKLVEAGKLADPKSVHTKGVAFDIDASGYYLRGVPINARQNLQKDFKKNFEELSSPVKDRQFGDYNLYNPKVHSLLLGVLTKMKNNEELHFVREYPNTTNEVFHVCLNPKLKNN